MIYLDNAATTQKKPQCVADALLEALNTMGNGGRGAHGTALKASRAIYDARRKIAQLMNCSRADHVVFTCNSTEALNIAIRGILNPGDHVISTDLEHNSVLRPLYELEAHHNVALSFVSANRQGLVDYDDFEKLIRPETRAIVCTHASNLTGEILDLYRIGEIAHKHNLLLLVDASQTAGCVGIDMEAMHIDVVCFTGHKGLYGPQGTGGLCIREGVEIRPFKLGGTGIHSYSKTQPEEYPTRLEAGTLNSHGIMGLSAALDFLQETGIDTIYAKEHELMMRFYNGVVNIPGVTVYGDFTSGHPRTAVVTLNIRDYDSSAVSDELAECYDIATRPGAHCAPRMHYALGTQDQGAVRFSFSWFSTEEEVDAAITAVKEIAEG